MLKYDRESRIERMMQKCVHYTGLMNLKCKLDIDYDTFEKQDKALPCLCKFDDKREQATCDKRQLYTRQECEEYFDDLDNDFNKTIVARKAIVAHIEATKQQGGTIPCPVCKSGSLAYIRHSNGHIHAKCGTDKCVGWME